MNCSPKSKVVKTVKRRFISMCFKVPEQGFYIREQLKIPYGNCKVVGVFTTSRVDPKCKDTTAQNVYYGTASEPMKDARFMDTATVRPYLSANTEDAVFAGQQGQWWFYAHPLGDNEIEPNFIENGSPINALRVMTPPVQISIVPKGECTPRAYLLWSEPLPAEGDVFVTYGQPS